MPPEPRPARLCRRDRQSPCETENPEPRTSAPSKTSRWPRKHDLFGLAVSAASYADATEAILEAAQRGESALVDHLSVHGLAMATRDASFRRALNAFELVAPDGQPVRWALNLLCGTELRDRVYGPELMVRLCRGAAEKGIGIYLYGSSPEVVERLREKLLERLPALRIQGSESPPFRPLTPDEDRAAVERIHHSGARIVFVGLGCPQQELYAYAHRRTIPAIQICVGAAFDFLAGAKPIAPRWMQNRGLEWLFRLLSEPRRLWRRYLVANSLFLLTLGRELLRRKLRLPARAVLARLRRSRPQGGGKDALR